jgi:hypothetical protein
LARKYNHAGRKYVQAARGTKKAQPIVDTASKATAG